jgi:hypothetical protein
MSFFAALKNNSCLKNIHLFINTNAAETFINSNLGFDYNTFAIGLTETDKRNHEESETKTSMQGTTYTLRNQNHHL